MNSHRIANGRRIRQAREAKGWTQARLSAELGKRGIELHQTRISRLECGSNSVRWTPELRAALTDALPGLDLADDAAAAEPDGPVVTTLPGAHDADAVAAHLGVDRLQVMAAARRKELKGRKIGRRWFFTDEAVRDWLAGPTRPAETTVGGFTTRARRKAS